MKLALRVCLFAGALVVTHFVLQRVEAAVSPAHVELVHGAMTVPAGGLLSYQVPVLHDLERGPTIKVDVRPFGARVNEIDVLILTHSDLSRWKIGLPVTPLFRAERITRVHQVVALPQPNVPLWLRGIATAKESELENFHVVFANRSASIPKTFEAVVRHEWVPISRILFQRGTRIAMLVLLISYALFLAVWKSKPRTAPEGYAVPSK